MIIRLLKHQRSGLMSEWMMRKLMMNRLRSRPRLKWMTSKLMMNPLLNHKPLLKLNPLLHLNLLLNQALSRDDQQGAVPHGSLVSMLR